VRIAVADRCSIFSCLIIVVWFSRQQSSPTLGRSPDLQVNASGLPLAVLGP
jgi:hypothetical protein